MPPYSVPAALQPPRFAEIFETAVAITPADASRIGPFAALYVGSGGTVVLVPRNSTVAVTFAGVPSGTRLPVAFQGVNATGTTASNLVGLA